MFDLQALAFQADITRVSSFMMARENVNRCVSEIGLPEAHPFDIASRQRSGKDEASRS